MAQSKAPAWQPKEFVLEIYQIWVEERPAQLAAALAFYGMFYFAPLIFIASWTAQFFLRNLSIETRLFDRLSLVFGREASAFLLDMVSRLSEQSTGATLLGGVVGGIALLWAASGLFVQLQYALNQVWKVPMPRVDNFLAGARQRLLSFALVVGVGLLLVLSAFANLIISRLGSILGTPSDLPVINLLPLLVLFSLSFSLLYKILPNTPIAWHDVWLGGLVTAVMVFVGGGLIGLYFHLSNIASAFEAAGAFAVILIGIYYIAQIFLLGAVFTRVYAARYGSKRSSSVDN